MRLSIHKFIFSLLPISLIITACPPPGWKAENRLTNHTAASTTTPPSSRSVSTDGNTIHVVWTDKKISNIPNVFYKRSTDGGTTWGNDIIISDYCGTDPSLSISGSNLCVTWTDEGLISNHTRGIYCKRSLNGGNTWSPESLLTSNLYLSVHSSVFATGTTLHLVWILDPSLGSDEIWYNSSSNFGSSWSVPKKVDIAFGKAGYPSIVASGNEVHIAYAEDIDEHTFIRSTNGGVTWGGPTHYMNNAAGGPYGGGPLSMCRSGQNIYVASAYNPINSYDIFCRRSIDGGATWGQDIQLNNSNGYAWSPCIAISGQYVHIAFADNISGNFKVYYKRSIDGGLTWQSDFPVSDNTTYATNVSISASGNYVDIVWHDARYGNDEVFHRRNVNNGDLFAW